jgi:hypothetical protein
MTFAKKQALERVQAYLHNLNLAGGADEYVVVESRTIEKQYGWVFVFNSKKFVETGNILYALGGNGPIIVEKDSGTLHQLGTASSLQDSVKEFEVANGLVR